jgi:hypothetical protein
MSKARGRHRQPASQGSAPLSRTGTASEALRPNPAAISPVVPVNARRLDDAREQWAAANWKALGQLDREVLEAHPDRDRLAIVGAAAALQTGDRRAAREQARLAAQWGCDKRFVLAVLVASARLSLGRASVAARRSEQATQHFQRSLFDPRMQSESRRIAGTRADEVLAELAVRREAASRQRKAGLKAEDWTVPGWIDDVVARCLSSSDVHEAVDTVIDQMLCSAVERVQFLMRLAAQYQAKQDRMSSVHFLNTARELCEGAPRELQIALAKQLVAAGEVAVAMDMLVNETIGAAGSQAHEEAFARSLAQAYKTLRDAEQANREHGHELLLAYLKTHVPRLRARSDRQTLAMVEIGTTRENVPGQGSTRKLAEFCKQHGISFVTVDMDPHNARMAEGMFHSLSTDFEAVAMKGEDYLRQRRAPIDFILLDAYDFDHGQHSELRQSRYLKYLGSRIDEQACHRMHLDCAQSLVNLLSPHGVVCLDDTWIDNGRWTAKGTLAMPFLLDHGFEVIDARNRAALLKRVNQA